MITSVSERSIRPHAGRVVLALAVTVVLWALAAFLVAVFLTAPMASFDGGDPSGSRLIGDVALVSAVGLFVGSGLIACLIGARRWLLTLPLIGAAIWAVGVVVAHLT